VNASPPLVSCVLATHDGAGTLGAAVRSLLRQTLEAVEVVVVDDSSTDGTAELLAEIDDPRLVVLRNDAQLGLAGSLNRGFDAAVGRYVARLDADDVAMPTRLERQLAVLRSAPDLALLGTSALELDARGRTARLHHMPSGDTDVRWQLLFSSPFFHPSVIVDSRALDRGGLRYDTEFAESEDYDLWARLLRIAKGRNLREPLLLKRVHPGQATQRRRDLQRSFQRKVALREIVSVAPGLGADGAELAWLVGSGEPVAADRLADAADAFVALTSAFEHDRGRLPRESRSRAARALARAAARAGGASVGDVLGRALRLDPGLPVGLVAGRSRRRLETRTARHDAERWLRTLDVGRADPIKVAVVSPEPTPYRSPLFDRIGTRDDVDLTVVYAARTVGGRTWDVETRHRAVYLEGVTLPLASRLVHHDYPVTPGIWRELRRARPDVVVVSGWSTFAAQAALLWCRFEHVPYILLVVSHDVGPRAGWRAAVKGAVVPRLVRGAANVLVVGTLARKSVLARGGRTERIRVFANTVDVEALGERADELAPRRSELRSELGLGDEDVVVVSVARLAPEKRHDLLVRAVADVADPRLALVLVGDGPERARFERLASTLGVRLVLAGDRPWAQVVEAYVAADVFALLSQRETWGVVVNEAAACGLPLVLSDHVGAAADLLQDGVNGSLVPAGGVDAAAAALARLAADAPARLAAGAESRRLVSNWGYGPSVESFVEAVREATAR